MNFKKKLIFNFTICCICFLPWCGGQTWTQVEKIVPVDRAARDQYGVTVAISNDYAVVGSQRVANGNRGGAFIIEKNATGDWVEVQKLFPSDITNGDYFANAVSIYESTVLIGAAQERDGNPGDPSITQSGSAYFFERDGAGNWIESQKIAPSERSLNDFFGESVAMHGDYSVIGVPFNNFDANGVSEIDDSGAAFIFEKDELGVWQETQKIVASDRDDNALFGYSVAIDGNKLAVGSFSKRTDATGGNPLILAGGAYVFERDANGNWNEAAVVVAPDREASDRFGIAVSIDGDYLAVGAYRKSITGVAYIYQRNSSGGWEFLQKIVPTENDGLGTHFGISVSLQGDYLLVGGSKDNINTIEQNAGAGFLFKRNSSNVWEEIQKIVASDRSEDDSFGFSMAMDGDYIIAGAYEEDDDVSGANTLNDAGSVYIFESDIALSIDNPSFADQIKMYPNPSLEKVTIAMNNIFDDANIRIFNIHGQQLKTMNFGNKNELSFNTNFLTSGIYIVELQAGNNETTFKLIKE